MAGGEGAAATREGAIGIANGDEAGGEDDGGEGAATIEGAVANGVEGSYQWRRSQPRKHQDWPALAKLVDSTALSQTQHHLGSSRPVKLKRTLR